MLTSRTVGLISLATLLATAPYLLAFSLNETFGGFLMNPVDGFSYLAKMRQGASGVFEFHLPYAAEPGPGSTLFVFHLALGRVAGALQLHPLVAYHAARLVGMVLMFTSALGFFARAIGPGPAQRHAFVIALFGSGVGWLGSPFGLLAIDLWVPEAVPLVSGYANAHFPFASAALLFAVSLIAFDDFLARWKSPLTFVAGLVLAITQPQTAALAGLVLVAWIGLEARAGWRRDPRTPRLLAYALGSAPVAIYAYFATQTHPGLSVWTAQNITPSPSPLETLLGYGLLVPLVIVALVRGNATRSAEARLMLVWAASNLLLLYAPVTLQRRLALGLFFPLAGLAALGIQAVARSSRPLLLALVLALSFPSHIAVAAAGIGAIFNQEPAFVIGAAERETFAWIERNAPTDTLVLAGPTTGNRIPAFTDSRVVYGHPFETPSAESKRREVIGLYGWEGDPDLGRARVLGAGVDYVSYGPEEQALGSPSWLQALPLEFESGRHRVYRVSDG